MTHPKDVSRPEGISLVEFCEREDSGELSEYVQFTADPTFDSSLVENFVEAVADACSNWNISSGRNPDGEILIEAHRVYHSVQDEPELPDCIYEREMEAQAEYYKDLHDAESRVTVSK